MTKEAGGDKHRPVVTNEGQQEWVNASEGTGMNEGGRGLQTQEGRGYK